METIAIPPVLRRIAERLRREQLRLSSRSNDGRVNSSANEDEIIDCIRENFDIKVPRKREWYDFAIETEDFYPVNIKVADTTKADNLTSKITRAFRSKSKHGFLFSDFQ